LALDNYEFAKRMRAVTGKIFVHPFQLCDGGEIVLRAKLRIHIANLLPDPLLKDALQNPLEQTLVIDLFDLPQRVAYREQILDLRKEMTEREAAHRLGLTVTATQRAAALDRLMKGRGLLDPYVRLTEPPPNYGQLRRHLHARYQFEPLPGYIPDW
jgi:site-specific DNA recombinase